MEDTLRNEINAGAWTIGYTGQSPERLQAHMRNMHVFDVKTLRARGGKDAKTGYDLTGDYYGLPWPCYGTRQDQAPGLAEPVRHLEARDGRRRQLPRAVRHGEGRRQPAGRGRLAPEGRRDHHRLPAVRPRAAEEAGLVGRAHRRGEEGSRGQDLGERPLRRHPARGDEARLPSVRQRQGARRGVELPRRRSRSTASRCSARGRTWSRSTRRTTTSRCSGACRRCSSRCSSRRSRTRCTRSSR